MEIFSHRGLFDLYPENSRSAIVAAIDKGYRVETDIRFTKDKKIVLIHDDNLSRLCGMNVKVNALHSKELDSIVYSSDPKVSLELFDRLAVFISNKNASVAIHFKQEEQNRENCLVLSRLFKEYNLYGCCFVFNLSLETCKIFRNIDPMVKTSILVSDKKFEPFVYLWSEIDNASLDLFDIVWAAEYEALYSDDFFRMIKGKGKKVVAVSHELHRNLGHPKAFTGYQASWAIFLKNNIDGVCTDFPDEFSAYVKGKSGLPPV